MVAADPANPLDEGLAEAAAEDEYAAMELAMQWALWAADRLGPPGASDG